jgi:hypothetical protein
MSQRKRVNDERSAILQDEKLKLKAALDSKYMTKAQKSELKREFANLEKTMTQKSFVDVRAVYVAAEMSVSSAQQIRGGSIGT